MKLSLTLATLASAAAAANQFNGLSYNPKQLKTGACPTVDTVRDDLSILSKYTNQVRIYSVNDCNQGEPVLRAMQNTDWKVQLGLWVSDVESVFQADKKELMRLAGVFDFKKQVSAVIVGNEAIYRKEQTSAQVAAKVRDIKAALAQAGLSDIPVTASETWPYYDPTLISAVDYVNVHAFPFWEGTPIQDAQDKIFSHIYDIKKLAGSKKVVVGETGWPDAGGNFEAAVPSLSNEQRFMKEFICRANMEKIDYIWFSAFDEAWKPVTNASDVETHWGIIKGDKTPKFASPMYDCKGFVPSSKPSSSASSSSASSSSQSSASSGGKSSAGHSASEISDLDGIDSDLASSLEESKTTKTSAASPFAITGFSAISLAVSLAALAGSAFV
ncbi:glycoside hydrolase 3 protein [Coemansia thaxteri]|uniref:glucan endo-1,3-beta-D-glucosidase n=1 Tax=Coemansia thaxteri TaxID=2663907 RepID=A0A9W8B9U7_9FUNG|nr:glycoside hydrolase 3 protein [Coemansia thaxteri]KAJ2003136.1 glycoside hydrolase 3 protein [Coemansia thaxteri]KAJ2470160.1 glycoside hydrolase 3 protein [Coemansia sp. RSA 2322]KAJ2479652.1 glycoside hydrolase 3 protein [Coemansia sp. RSA 2320]